MQQLWPKGVRWAIWTGAGALALLVAACGGGAASSADAPRPADFEGEAAPLGRLILGEFFFQEEGYGRNTPLTLETGRWYRVEIKNAGEMLHEVIIGKNAVFEDGRPDRYQQDLLDGIEVKVHTKTLVWGEERGLEVEAQGLDELELDPGVTLELEFALPKDRKGQWEIGCFAPGHYESGMKAPLIVT